MSGHFKPHVSLELNSRRRTRGTIENYRTFLSHQIKFNQSPKKQYFMRLENIQLPKSYYDINSTNNVFQVIETDGVTPHTVTITISPGNYTITELLTELESGLDTNTQDANDYTLSYDDVTNKVTVRYDGGTSTSVTIDTIANGSTLNQVIGFGKADTDNITGGDNTTVLADGVDSVAPNCVNMRVNPYIVVETSITSRNHYNEDEQINIGARVPLLIDRNEYQYYENTEGHLTMLNNKGPISEISLTLRDEYGNVVDLNECEWYCEMVIYELTRDN